MTRTNPKKQSPRRHCTVQSGYADIDLWNISVTNQKCESEGVMDGKSNNNKIFH